MADGWQREMYRAAKKSVHVLKKSRRQRRTQQAKKREVSTRQEREGRAWALVFPSCSLFPGAMNDDHSFDIEREIQREKE